MNKISLISKTGFALMAIFVFGFAPQSYGYSSKARNAQGQPISLDVPYVPTPQRVVDRMLELAKVKPGETVYDLGSGDGRIVVTAAKKYGAKGVGIDLDPERVQEANENVRKNGVQRLVSIREGNALKADLSSADVVTLYLLSSVNLQLRPQLQQLPKGTRIVSHDFDMGDWTPVKHETISVDGRDHQIYLWIVGQSKTQAQYSGEK